MGMMIGAARRTTIKPDVHVHRMKCQREWPESNAVLADHIITSAYSSLSDLLIDVCVVCRG